MVFWQRKHLGAASLARSSFNALLEPGQNEHDLSRLVRERGGDEKWADAMVAELETLRCDTCKRTTSPAMMRTYAQVRKALHADSELAAALVAALESARPAQETLSNARNMTRDERFERVVEWLARDAGVPVIVMREAVERARSANASGAVVVESPHANGNGSAGEGNATR